MSAGNRAAPLVPGLVLTGLLLSAAVVAIVVPPVAPGQETLRVAGIPVPTMCMLRATTGMPCAGCGLTRSWIAALHGEWGWSFAHHRLGLVALVYLLLQAIRYVAVMALPRPGVLGVAGRWLDLGAIALAALFLVNWLVGLFSAT